ncbi:MAG: hypothetical protein KC912_25245 [Proteobacteria bacterium]|nr:hypothetical protein [Pseudomonadota bacterium]
MSHPSPAGHIALSTAISDLMLATTTASSAVWLLRNPDALRRYGAIGMGTMALASGIGTVRFAGFEGLERVHAGASHLAGAIAPACFALVALLVFRRGHRWIADAGIAALLAGWAVFEVGLKLDGYRTALGTLAILALLGASIATAGRHLWASLSLGLGALGIALAGLVIGTEGSVGPLLAVDLFHVVLALSHAGVAYGLAVLPGPSSG